MTFQEFTEEMKFYLANEFGHDPKRMKFLPVGMTGQSDYELLTISDTNIRYFNDDASKSLLGNFLITEWPEGPLPTTGKDADTIERFYMDALYEDCQRDGFTSVLEKLRKGKEESDLSKKSDTLEHIEDYELTKLKLILRPINYRDNRTILRNCIYRRIGDIALVLYMIIAHESGNYMTSKVPRVVFDVWNKPEDEVIDFALNNTQRLHPAKAATLIYKNDIRTGITLPQFVDLGLLEKIDTSKLHNARYITIMGQDTPNGAISVFFPGMMEWLYDKIGCPYYVVFTSVNEAMIHSVKLNNLKDLKSRLSRINANTNKPDEFLSRKVYKYTGKEFVEMD